MKRLGLGGLMLALLSGCSGMNHTESGALAGGALGAGAGAIIGSATGHTGAGAAIGAASGALIGGAAGNCEDRREQRQTAAAAAYARRNPPMTVTDVIQLSQARTPAGQIIHQMDSTGSWFNLSTADLIELRQQGVSDDVIHAMQSRRQPPPYVLRPRHEVVFVEPPPPVSVGIGYGRRGW